MKKLRFEGVSFSDVARDGSEAAQLSDAIEDRRANGLSPKSRSVLAHAPTFDLLSFGRFEHGEFVTIAIVVAYLGWEDDRHRLTDRFFRCVAGDPLCAGVPTGDAAFEIEQDDQVIVDGID